MSKRQTAIEWFLRKTNECTSSDEFWEYYRKCKRLERLQIIDAYNQGVSVGQYFGEEAPWGDEYYEENYIIYKNTKNES